MTLCSSHLFDLKRAKKINERIVQVEGATTVFHGTNIGALK